MIKKQKGNYYNFFTSETLKEGLYKMGKSCPEVMDKCCESHNYIKHKKGKCYTDSEQLLSFTNANGILTAMILGYGDELIKISFEKRHHRKLYKASIKQMHNTINFNIYHTTGYAVETVMNIREKETIDYLLKVQKHKGILPELQLEKFGEYMHAIGAEESYKYLCQELPKYAKHKQDYYLF